MSRAPKILIAIFGLDQHEIGAMAAARLLSDAGMEVVYAGRFQLPPMIVEAAREEDVDVIGLSCHSWEYLNYTDELMALLAEAGMTTPVVLGGSVLTRTDQNTLEAKGVAATFGPTATPDQIVARVRALAGASD